MTRAATQQRDELEIELVWSGRLGDGQGFERVRGVV